MEAHKVEPIKRLLEKATGLGVPTREEALACVRQVKPQRMKFRDDGYVPNNPKLPLLYYRKALRFFREHDKAVASIRRVAVPKQNPLFGLNQPQW